jgi:uncharacterized membrane protein YgcG
MSVKYLLMGIVFVHFVWAFINTISIHESFFISKFKKVSLIIINWFIPIIGPTIVYYKLKYASQHRRISGGSSDNVGSYYAESGGSDCGGGGGGGE